MTLMDLLMIQEITLKIKPKTTKGQLPFFHIEKKKAEEKL